MCESQGSNADWPLRSGGVTELSGRLLIGSPTPIPFTRKKRKYFPIPFNGKPVSFARSFSVFFFSIRPPSGARLHLPNAPFRRLGASCMLMLFPFLPSNVNLPPSMSIHWKDPPSPPPPTPFSPQANAPTDAGPAPAVRFIGSTSAAASFFFIDSTEPESHVGFPSSSIGRLLSPGGGRGDNKGGAPGRCLDLLLH